MNYAGKIASLGKEDMTDKEWEKSILNQSSAKCVGPVMVAFVIGLFISFSIMTIAMDNMEYNLKAEAIKTGAAYYHPVTAKFTWGKLQVPQ